MMLYLEPFNDTLIRSTYEEFPLLMPRWGYVASAFVLFLIGFFGFFLNLMVILLMFKDRQLWTPLNIILFNLVCSDFSVSLFGNPFTLISALFHHWIFGHTLCVLYGFFMALLGITSITTLTVISFERYMMVTKPFNSRHLTSKGAVLSIVFIWAYSLALTTPPLFGWGKYEYEAANISCSVNWHEQSFNTLTYILFLFALGQILPFTIITFSYVNIIRTMRKNSQRLGRVNRAEARATAMVLLMIISFTVSWTPYSLFALMEQFATEGIVSPGAGVIPALVAKSSICYNPLIYVGMNTQFRQSIKRIFSMQTKCRNSETKRGDNNTFLSPSHKLSVMKDTTSQNSSESFLLKTPKKLNKSDTNSTDKTNVTIIEKVNKQVHKYPKLCLIDEKMSVLDAERSGESIFDDDTSNSNRKLEMFGKSCILNDQSPVLTIVDANKLCFTKVATRENEKQLYEELFTEVKKIDDTDESFKRPKIIKHSYSLDLGSISHEEKRRKFSIETKLESIVAPKSFMGKVVSKFFEQNGKQNNIKTYLCENQDNQGNEELT